MGAPRISVVIPTLGTREEISVLLESLAPSRQGLSSDSYEVILSFDGPQCSILQCSIPLCSFPQPESAQPTTIVDGEKGGPARARNRGARHAKGALLVFIDDDCVAEEGLLKEYDHTHSREPDAVLEGKTRPPGPRTTLAVTAPANEEGGRLWSCNFAISSDLFTQLGGFDERFPYPAMEDVEFRERVIKSGRKIIFLPHASVVHEYRLRGRRDYFEKHFDSTLLYESIHPEKRMYAVDHWRAALCGVYREILPGLFTFQGRGTFTAWRDYYHMIIAGWRKLLRGHLYRGSGRTWSRVRGVK